MKFRIPRFTGGRDTLGHYGPRRRPPRLGVHPLDHDVTIKLQNPNLQVAANAAALITLAPLWIEVKKAKRQTSRLIAQTLAKARAART